MKRKLRSGQPGEIFYKFFGDIEVVQVIDRIEGYRDDYNYSDVNADTIICYAFIAQKEVKFDSRSSFVDAYIWDQGGTSSANNLGFSDRHAHIILRLFEEYR